MEKLLESEVENLTQLIKSLKNRLLPYGLINGLAAETNGKVTDYASFAAVLAQEEILRQAFALALARWDQSEPSETFRRTRANTAPRRAVMYDLLAVPPEVRGHISAAFPVAGAGSNESEIVLADWEPWYQERKLRSSFYWDAYETVLLGQKGWNPEAIRKLDLSSSKVVARLSNPASEAPYQSKGLVVGHVQSGKTAHFTGVVAKAIDSGYRLVIVLAGMHDILRNQTQRRLDMELVGRQNILAGRDENTPSQIKFIDYARAGDLDWNSNKFLVHDIDPWSEPEIPKISRLTSSDKDYRALGQGLGEIQFAPHHRDKPLFDPENLKREHVRLVVVKKNKSKLEAFIEDLRAQSAGLDNVPALIIDDEADQASINTRDTRKHDAQGRRERTAINRLVTDMLNLMPRAQYLAYTATPFANVFVDAEDAKDLFPRDFIIGLETPDGYMGGKDFHDFEVLEDGNEPNVSNRNELAYVRDIDSSSETALETATRDAIDAFVLSGAMKLWRQSVEPSLKFRHHTMLVHESVRVAEHEAVAQRVRQIWHSSGPETHEGLERLRRMFMSDFQPVSTARNDGFPVPGSFDELLDFVGEVRQRSAPGGDPVVIVNGQKVDEYNRVDFDSEDFWRILVGGTKLSRGYTVEGLTVSFYRRSAGQEDTLMQMGRWFGYRRGYKDLIRLFIDRGREVGKRTLDLYSAFGDVVQGEAKFREQLSQYSMLGDDGKPLVQPFQVPPLVWQSAELKPTASNKMFNASLVLQGHGGTPMQFGRPMLPSQDSRAHALNFALVEPWLRERGIEKITIGPYVARVAVIGSEDLIRVIDNFRWHSPEAIEPRLAYLKKIVDDGRFEDFVMVLPQLKSDREIGIDGLNLRISAKYRRQDRPEFTLPNETDRKVLETLSGKTRASLDKNLASLVSPKRGSVMLSFAFEDGLHPGIEKPATENIATIITLTTPYEEGRLPELAWSYRNAQKPSDVVVDP